MELICNSDGLLTFTFNLKVLENSPKYFADLMIVLLINLPSMGIGAQLTTRDSFLLMLRKIHISIG